MHSALIMACPFQLNYHIVVRCTALSPIIPHWYKAPAYSTLYPPDLSHPDVVFSATFQISMHVFDAMALTIATFESRLSPSLFIPYCGGW